MVVQGGGAVSYERGTPVETFIIFTSGGTLGFAGNDPVVGVNTSRCWPAPKNGPP